MVNTSIMHDEWASWEIDPSTRTSTHPFTKYYPFKLQIDTSNTAEDLFTVARGNSQQKGLLFLETPDNKIPEQRHYW